jgi:hypothetical protein
VYGYVEADQFIVLVSDVSRLVDRGYCGNEFFLQPYSKAFIKAENIPLECALQQGCLFGYALGGLVCLVVRLIERYPLGGAVSV